VVVVGDTHGHVQDVAHMMRIMGPPGPRNLYVFNGDFVDRGAWGLETVLLLAAWRLAVPEGVVLLRGNHESVACTTVYGFLGEALAKYGAGPGRAVWRAATRAFAGLPLACVVGRATLVVHGGLWRAPPAPMPPPPPGLGGLGGKRRRKGPARRAPGPVTLGTLDQLRAASKGGIDPSGRGASALAADVLWSDPAAEPGLALNEGRGVGLTFGPDVTAAFLAASNLRLVLRSHEGPDARDGRACDGMAGVLGGYAVDHAGPGGRLCTVFSAPDYPMFQQQAPCDDAGEGGGGGGEGRYSNLGAVAVLSAPSWSDPAFVQYAAAPRPSRPGPYYELDDAPDSDEDVPPGFGAAASSASEGGATTTTGGGCSLLDGGGVCREAVPGVCAADGGGGSVGYAPHAAAGVEQGEDAESARPATRRRLVEEAVAFAAAPSPPAAAPPLLPSSSPTPPPHAMTQPGPHHAHAHPTRHPASPRAGPRPTSPRGGGGGGRPPPASPPGLLFVNNSNHHHAGSGSAGGLMVAPPFPLGGAASPPGIGLTSRGRSTRGGAAAAAARAVAGGVVLASPPADQQQQQQQAPPPQQPPQQQQG